jgi:hypothetical protein
LIAACLAAALLAGCKKKIPPPATAPAAGGGNAPIAQLPLPPAGQHAPGGQQAPAAADPANGLYGDQGGEETLDPNRAPVGAPLRARKTDAFYRIGNPRFEQQGFGPFQHLVVDYERRRDGDVQNLVLILRTPDGQSGTVQLRFTGRDRAGQIAVRGGFGPFDQIPRTAELYLVSTDGRYEQRPQFKVSNSVSLGNVQGTTFARNWTAEEAGFLRNPPPPPKKYVVPNNDPNVGKDTQLVGEQTAPGPFRYVDPTGHLLGFDYWMAGWDNGKGQREPSPSGSFTAVFSHDQPVAPASKRVAAKPGYAVGAVTVHTRVFVNALKLTYYKIKPDGSLDPSDAYDDDWLGEPQQGGKTVTLGGDGKRVIGFLCRRGGVLNSIGLVTEK